MTVFRLRPRVIRLLREIYASPLDPGYWDQLERRIVARVAAERVGGGGGGSRTRQVWTEPWVDPWGEAFGAWARAGMIAAGIAVICAGLATWRSHVTEARAAQAAYETMLTTPMPSGASWLLADAVSAVDGAAP